MSVLPLSTVGEISTPLDSTLLPFWLGTSGVEDFLRKALIGISVLRSFESNLEIAEECRFRCENLLFNRGLPVSVDTEPGNPVNDGL